MLPARPAPSLLAISDAVASVQSIPLTSFSSGSSSSSSATSHSSSFGGTGSGTIGVQGLPAFEPAHFAAERPSFASSSSGASSGSSFVSLPAIAAGPGAGPVEVVPAIGYKMGSSTDYIEVIKSEGQYLALAPETASIVSDVQLIPVGAIQSANGIPAAISGSSSSASSASSSAASTSAALSSSSSSSAASAFADANEQIAYHLVPPSAFGGHHDKRHKKHIAPAKEEKEVASVRPGEQRWQPVGYDSPAGYSRVSFQ